MATIVNWWKRLFGQYPAEVQSQKIQIGDLELIPSSQTVARAETALPGTENLEPIIRLAPPPVDSDLVGLSDPDAMQDYTPSPVAEWSLTFEANQRFDCAELAQILHARHDEFSRPMHHVRTPEGQITYLSSSDTPPHGIALIPAWSLGEWANPDKEKIFVGAQALAKALTELPDGFQATDISFDLLEKQVDQVSQLTAIKPRTVIVVAHHPEGGFWKGREIWALLHQLGLKWGDMDCFQWADPTNQTDYLIWVEVDDGDLGYALPERIAAGEQNFRAIKFSFDILRSPAPEHVLSQLVVITAAYQKALSCNLKAFLDDDPVASPEELRQGVESAVQHLKSLGLKPGSDDVCRLV
ncbi:hypothetical protein [Ruegeria sp. Ofav3-42]|uniref:hypothetical protein n=1 Tax=Ruegeria sp. Ofav3-42 TaxID=2917759 RepID=UPI001EF6EFF4|nr:hypothetical protein [Ruegeria sp. Ofav3-42]MCG7518871.1 hypothetical protein [Ruegeria sp. Ofav3-42]